MLRLALLLGLLALPLGCEPTDDDDSAADDDDSSPCQEQDFWPDGDGDGHGDATAAPTSACEAPDATWVGSADDCDDAEPTVHPEATELCDGVDQDCDGEADDGLAFEDSWPDDDGDGHGDPTGTPASTCDGPPTGYASPGDDCDDGDAANFPGHAEACDGADNDCDAEVDEGVLTLWYPDTDGDSYGDPDATPVEACDPPGASWVANADDCDDGVANANPAGDPSVCDGVDSDCDELVEEILVPGDHPTIQAAVDAAPDGSLVCIEAGTWEERVTVSGKALVLSGAGREDTILDGGGAGTTLTLDDAGATEVRHLSVTGGSLGPGPGLLKGAGVHVSGGAPLFEDVAVFGNACTGWCLGVGFHSQQADLALVDVSIHDNVGHEADSGQSLAGVGLYGEGGSITATGLDVVDNDAQNTDHPADGLAIAVHWVDFVASDLLVSGCSGVPQAGTAGIAVTADAGSFLVVGGSISDNFSPDAPGRAFGGVNNEAGDYHLENLTVSYNVGHMQVGVFQSVGPLTLLNSNITFNQAMSGDDGYALWLNAAGGEVRNTVVAFNSSDSPGSDSGIQVDASNPPTVAYSLFWENGDDIVGMDDPAGSGGNLRVDPGFADGPGGDQSPGATSPLVDAGDPAILDTDSSRSDIGATGGPNAP